MTLPRKPREDYRDPSSPAELAAIWSLNQDQNRSYPEIDRRPRSFRVQIVLAALPACSSRFSFCRQTARLARMIHRPDSQRFAHSLNAAMRMITTAGSTPRPVVVTREAA